MLRPERRRASWTPPASRSSARVELVDWDEATAEKAGYETFMLKEIHEQADAVADAIADRTARRDGVDLQEEGAFDESLLDGRAADRDRRPAAPPTTPA